MTKLYDILQFLLCLWLVVVVVVASGSKGAQGNLPPDAQLRIGIKHRAPVCPRKTQKGDTLSMHYVGTLRVDGSKFDSSRDRDSPFQFTLGAGQVIQGWDQGLVGMCVGERRKLTIPSDLGYGDHGSPPKIPGKATLVFEVELLDIVNSSADRDDDDHDEF